MSTLQQLKGRLVVAPPKKRSGTQQPRGGTRRQSPDLALVPGERLAPPLPDAAGNLLKVSEVAWRTFWLSLSAAAAEDVDLVVAERWILAYDEYRRSLNTFRRKRLVEGSTGQPVLNPLGAWVTSREAAMHKAEQQLGIGVKNRTDLAIGVGNARLTAAQLNRMTEETPTGADEDDIVDAELLEEFSEAQ